MFYIVVYDSNSEKRRRRLRQHLKNFLFRVQMSVFEGHLDLASYRKMVEPVPGIIDMKQDSVRIYEVTKDGFEKMKVYGFPPKTEDKSFYYFGNISNESENKPVAQHNKPQPKSHPGTT